MEVLLVYYAYWEELKYYGICEKGKWEEFLEKFKKEFEIQNNCKILSVELSPNYSHKPKESFMIHFKYKKHKKKISKTTLEAETFTLNELKDTWNFKVW